MAISKRTRKMPLFLGRLTGSNADVTRSTLSERSNRPKVGNWIGQCSIVVGG